MTAFTLRRSLPPEIACLRPQNPPQRRGLIRCVPRPPLPTGRVRHRRHRDDPWPQGITLDPEFAGLGRHRRATVPGPLLVFLTVVFYLAHLALAGAPEEDVPSWVETLLGSAVLLLFAAGLLVVGVRSV